MKEKMRYGIERYFILGTVLAFLGWLWETALMFALTGEYYDRGFMTLPFCPIYATGILGAYFLLGTPKARKGLLSDITNERTGYLLYATFCFVIPTLTELCIGLFFDRVLHVRLWEYSSYPYHFHGYVCLPVSLAWTGMLFIFMRFLFQPLKTWIARLPRKISWGISILLGISFLLDGALHIQSVLK